MSYPINPELDLVLERTIDVSPDKVFAAWTNPESLKHWFCPKPWRLAECDIDLRPGGKFRTVMEGPDGERIDNTGCYLEIIENEKLIFTDALGPDFRPTGGGFMTAVLIFTPIPGGTKYTAYALHKDPDTRTQHEQMGFHDGWGTVVDQMVEYIKAND